jgi:hypothetical protein
LNFEEETVQKSREVTEEESSEKNSVSNSVSDSGSEQGSVSEKSESKEDDFTSSFLDRIANTNIGNEDKIYNHNNVLLGGTIEEMIIGNDVNFKKYSSKMFGNLIWLNPNQASKSSQPRSLTSRAAFAWAKRGLPSRGLWAASTFSAILALSAGQPSRTTAHCARPHSTL